MEPDRPKVDRQVLEFVRSKVFEPRDFMIDSKEVCRLHPRLARTVARRIGDTDIGLLVEMDETIGTPRPTGASWTCPSRVVDSTHNDAPLKR